MGCSRHDSGIRSLRTEYSIYGILAVLTESTGGPDEAYIILQSLMRHFEENYGIRGGFIMEARD